MRRRARIFRNIAIGLVLFTGLAILAGIEIVQTNWFRSVVKEKIIASTEASFGGRVEIGSFSFDWRHLRAVVTGFVIHGAEPSDAAPFVRASRIELDLRLFTSIHHLLDIAYLGIDQPEVNIVLSADGRSNVPTPKTSATSNQPPLEPVVNAAIDHFDMKNGTIKFASGKQNIDLKGDNLRAELWFNVLKQGYRGQVSFQPLSVISGRNPEVPFLVRLPIAIESDRVDFQNASITTPKTRVFISGSVQNLRDPRISAHVNGHIALTDLRNAAHLSIAPQARNVPSSLDLDATATVSNTNIQVTSLRLGIGRSNLEASGTLKDPSNTGSLEFKTTLALGELARLTNLTGRPEGTLMLNGTVKLDPNNNYDVNGNVQAKNASFEQGAESVSNINLASAFHLDPHELNLNGFRLTSFGGELMGNLSLWDFERYRLHGNLKGLSLRALANSLGEKKFGYDGFLTGPIDAGGDLKSKSAIRSMLARARLSIQPGKLGIPISGRLYADYNGAADNLLVDNSYIVLPHTRLNFSGSVNKQLNVALTTSDLNDFLVATPMGSKSPVTLNDRQSSFTGTITGGLTTPHVTGHLHTNSFTVEDRTLDSLDADASLSRNAAAVKNGALRRGNMQMLFSAEVGLKDWQPAQNQALSAEASIRNGDLADVLALAGRPRADYSGAMSATLLIHGTVANPTGTANLTVSDGLLDGEPFDRIQAQINLADQLVTIPAATIEAGTGRVDLTAEYRHSRDSFTTGQLKAHVQSNEVNLAQLPRLQKQRPNTGGLLQANLDFAGDVSPSNFLLTAMNGDVSARGLRLDGENYGDLNATARTTGQAVQYQLTSDFAGSNIRVTGNTQLRKDYPTTADASFRSLPIERVLAAAQRTDIPAKGTLSGTGHFSGTKDSPQGNVDAILTNAVLYEEPLDRIQLKASYQPQRLDIEQGQIHSGPAHIEFAGRFDHPRGSLDTGTVQFRLTSSGADLARIHNVQTRRPGLAGALQISADGSAEIRTAEPKILLRDLTGNIAANHVALKGKNYGDLTLKANTEAGKLNLVLASNLAGASIQGHGITELADHYPVDAQLSFNNLQWSRIQDLIGQDNSGAAVFDVATDGQVSIRGSAMDLDALRASIQLSRFELSSFPRSQTGAKPVSVKNQGPITAALDRQSVHIQSAHLVGPQTDIQTQGSFSLKDQSLNLTLNATANLALLQDFDRDIASSGSAVFATTVRGTSSNPLLNGKVELHNGALNYSGFSNGISNANGVVLLTGNGASVRNLTAESGGGKITLGGFMILSGVPRFGLKAQASSVRVELQQGASIVADGNLSLTGTAAGSELSGTATITHIIYTPHNDFASFLTRAAPPVQNAATASSWLDNVKLDVHVHSSDALGIQTSLAQSIQGQADLRIRGTASYPGVLGRINITEGSMNFFGNNYTVNSGSIAFYNPVRIEPVLDVSLQTQAQSVDVTLRVTGPIDNLKLSYTSDPPLQFQEIIGLLAAGQTPTSDPTLLANQPVQPSQSFEQMGESVLLGSAVANPAASRLARVFGVTQLRINPTFTSGSQLPAAQMSLQQQVSKNITFTYVSAFDNANAETIRVDIRLTRQWSAVAMRDEFGIVSVNLLYKREVR